MTCNGHHGMLTLGCLQAKKVQRKNFSHSEARLREIKRENKMMVDRLAHVTTSQTHTPLPPAPVGDPSSPSRLIPACALMTELVCQTSACCLCPS